MNQAEFVTLYREHLPALSKYLVRRVERDLVEDLAADVLEIAWKKRDSAPKGMELAWLYRIAGFVLANHRRKQSNRGASWVIRDSDLVTPSAESIALKDLELGEAFGSLSPADRQILALFAIDGLSVRELAVSLGISPNTASVRLKRARERLARALEN
ncbi:MAG: hypothetical protein RLZZ400_130 [Actinomycetota bacterium]|jgi:RNA polymerase sigma-70 factor, ECF subfamily